MPSISSGQRPDDYSSGGITKRYRRLPRWLTAAVCGAALCFGSAAHAGVTSENFDATGLVYVTTTSIPIGTWTFTSASATGLASVAHDEWVSNLNSGGGRCFVWNLDAANISAFGLKSTDGTDFALSSFKLGSMSGGSTTVSISGWRDNVQVVADEVVDLETSDSGGNITYALTASGINGSYGSLTFGSAFSNVDEIRLVFSSLVTAEIDDIVVAAVSMPPALTAATYDANTGVLSVTAANLTSGNAIAVNKLTLTGEGGSTYTLTTANVTALSSSAFSVTLNATDRAAVNPILNKNGTSSTGGTTYNVTASDDWYPSVTAGDTSDATNSVTVSNVAVPALTSATYNAATGALVVTGTNFLKLSGATNDIVANKFTVTGEGGATYTLTDTANVEITSSTAFTVVLSATDKAALTQVLNKGGTSSVQGTTYNLAAAEDWAAGANAAVVVADATGNGITVSGIVAPDAPSSASAIAGDAQAVVSFVASTSNGGAAITGYTVTASPGGATGTGASSPIVVTGLINGTAYTFTVTATNSAGTSSASTASSSVTPKGSQTITFANPGAQNFGTTPTLTATATSGLTPTFTSSTPGVATITSGGALTFLTAGTATISADQAGNAAYDAATTVTQSFTVNAVVPGAATAVAASGGDTQATVTFTAPAFTGGASITGYTVTSSPGGNTATGAGSPIIVTSLTNGVAYTFTVTATNSAGTSSASTASSSVTPKGSQTITFANPGAQNFGTTPTLTATATSGLTPTFTSSTPSVATITSGGALTFLTAGTATISADQAGNAAYDAATTVTQSFTVNAVTPGAPTAVSATGGDSQATVTFAAPAFSGGASITGYTVISSPGGLTGTGVSSPIVVTGLTNGTAYTFTVTATNSAGTGSASSASPSVTPGVVPVIGTGAASNLGHTTATLGGNVISDGGLAITERGIVVGSTSNPTTSNTKFTASGTTGAYTVNVTGLTAATTYHYRAYAINAVGTSYGLDGTFNTPALATELRFTTLPSGSVSGSAFTGQPVVTATDALGNVDSTFTGNVTLSLASGAGTLSGTVTVAAVNGVATFSDLVYSATVDQQAFTLTTANSASLSNATSNSVTSDVVATKLHFSTQPSPVSLDSGVATAFTTIPVVQATDAANVVDAGYSTAIVLSLTNGSGGTAPGMLNSFTVTGDTDGSAATVTLVPVSGEATFAGLNIRYTNDASATNTVALSAASGSLTSALSSALTSSIDTTPPVITSATTASATYKSAFSGYTVTASGGATSFGAIGLPTGLTIDAATGVISGSPSQSGSFTVALTAADASGNIATASLALSVAKVPLTVTGLTANNKTYDGTTSATLNVSGAILAGVIGGDTVTLVTSGATGTFASSGVGTPAVTVSGLTLSGADAGHYTMTPLGLSASITHATASLAIGNLAQTYAGSPRTIAVSTTPGGLTVAISYAGSATAPTNAGSYPVSATITDGNYQGSSSATLVIAKAAQTLRFDAPASIAPGASVTLRATASSGLPVTFSLISGDGTLVGSSLTVARGSVTVRATQSGNGNVLAATADHTVTVAGPAEQTITFPALIDRMSNDAAFDLAATASSGLPVTFTVASGPAMISGQTVTLTGVAGTVAITASQSGNAAFAPAISVTRAFNVSAAGPRIFIGNLLSHSIPSGDIGAVLPPSGSSGSLVIVAPNLGVEFALDFTVQPDGTFVSVFVDNGRTPLQDRARPVAAAARTLTLRGRLDGNVLSGRFDEIDLAFSVPVQGRGSSTEVAGFYQASTLNSAGGATYSVVGNNGEVVVLAQTMDAVIGGRAALNADGTFTLLTDAAGLQGAIDPATTTVTGTVSQPGRADTQFFGVASTTLRTDRLINLSSRVRVGPDGGRTLITGFVIGGNDAKRVLLRAVGPALSGLGMNGALSNPRLELYNHAGVLLLQNDDWAGAETAAAFAQVGAFTLAAGTRDAALITTLAPGAYTMRVVDGGESGIALAEIYDASANPSGEYQRLVNISSRGMVEAGDGVLIGGFVVTGNAPKKVLVRGVGPGLAAFGVSATLSDPRLTVYSGQTVVAQNNDWTTPIAAGAAQVVATASEIAAAAGTTGAFAFSNGSKDAAVIVTLAPGAYTAQVTSADGTSTGVALVEIYEIPE